MEGMRTYQQQQIQQNAINAMAMAIPFLGLHHNASNHTLAASLPSSNAFQLWQNQYLSSLYLNTLVTSLAGPYRHTMRTTPHALGTPYRHVHSGPYVRMPPTQLNNAYGQVLD